MTAMLQIHRAPSVAALFHGLDWCMPHDSVEIDTGITLHRLAGTGVEKLYRRFCGDCRVNGEDPAWCEFFALLAPAHGDPRIDHPFSPLDRLCNVITLACDQPPDLCRVIRSSDQFNTILDTDVLFGPGNPARRHFTNEDVGMVEEGWFALKKLCEENGTNGRLARALSFFSQGWRARDHDQALSNFIATLDILMAAEPSRMTLASTHRSVAERLEHLAPAHFLTENLVRASSRCKEGRTLSMRGVVHAAFRLSRAMLREMLLNPELTMALDTA